jgi:hypothetical protein
MTAKLVKSKIFWFAAAYACILAVALVFALQATPEVEHHDCTLEDMRSSFKLVPIYGYLKNHPELSLTDEIDILVYIDPKPTSDEIKQIEQLGITIDSDSWIPPLNVGRWDSPWGSYLARCSVENLCALDGEEHIEMVLSVNPPIATIPEACITFDPEYCERDDDCMCINDNCFTGNIWYWENCISELRKLLPSAICMDLCYGVECRCVNNECSCRMGWP